MKPTIVLVGRPNVGKSTLFNRLTKTRDALVADLPGLTRDRHYGHGKVGDRPYLVVDTGGFEPVVDEGIMFEMARQTLQAIDEADAIVFLVDGRTGITPQDKIIANRLPRMVFITRRGAPTSSVPPTRAEPVIVAVRGSSCMIPRNVTDLPEPLSPTTPTASPGSMSRSTPRTAETGPLGVRNVTCRSRMLSAGSAMWFQRP